MYRVYTYDGPRVAKCHIKMIGCSELYNIAIMIVDYKLREKDSPFDGIVIFKDGEIVKDVSRDVWEDLLFE